jgi:hypothetical protein
MRWKESSILCFTARRRVFVSIRREDGWSPEPVWAATSEKCVPLSQLNLCRLQCRSDIPAVPHTFCRKIILLWFSIIPVCWMFTVAQFREYLSGADTLQKSDLSAMWLFHLYAVLCYDWMPHPGDIEHGGASAQVTSPRVRYQDIHWGLAINKRALGMTFLWAVRFLLVKFSLKLHSGEWTKDPFDAAVQTVSHPTTNE